MSCFSNCLLCPRGCGADRRHHPGFCGAPATLRAARAGLHFWEEPCISGTRGSGAVFFSGCNLKCRFCQNYELSHHCAGKPLSVHRLADIFLELQQQGAHNINLVTPTVYAPLIRQALLQCKNRLHIPVIYNCGGYESSQTLYDLQGLIDIFMPDIKFFDPVRSAKYCNAPDYFERCANAVDTMLQLTGPPVLDNDGLLKSGVLIRHLVMPGCYRDSLQILDWLDTQYPSHPFLLSLMRQYVPCGDLRDYPELNRRVTSYEYERVTDRAADLGFTGYTQERTAADAGFIPVFDGSGI